MDRDLRASLIASGAAALLSILVGIVSGIEVLPLILRALLGGLAFGAFVFGALAVMRRFLPEILSAPPSESLPETGGNVDIVLPGEGPETVGVEARPAGEMSRSRRSRPTGTEEYGEMADFEGESLLEDGASSAGEDIEELSAEDSGTAPAQPDYSDAARAAPVASESGKTARARSAAPFAASQVAAPAGIASVDGGQRVHEPRGQVGMDELDVLPDLDSLSDGFSRAAPDGGDPDIHTVDSGRSREAGGEGRADPAMLAKAVRTLLKRDQER